MLKALFFISASLLLFSLYFHSSFEFNQDLGRHLLLGKIITTTWAIPKTNLFTYTNTDFPFVNTHWLSEVIFYLFSNTFGNSSLITINSTLLTASLLTLVYFAYKKTGSIVATAVGFAIFVPVLLERTEVRPEMFSYVLTVIFVIVLYKYLIYIDSGSEAGMTRKTIWILPVLELFWVNLHIYFFLGPMLVFLALLAIRERRMFYILVLTIVATLINPNGLIGAMYPLFVNQNYNYQIVENQSIFTLERLEIFNPNIFYFKIAFILYFISFILRKYQKSTILTFSILTAGLTVLPIMTVRSLPFLFFINFYGFVYNLANIREEILEKIKNKEIIGNIILISAIALTCYRSVQLITSDYYNETVSQKEFGSKMLEQGKNGVDFLLANNLRGPIFNNFDIGGYLDYRLYPSIKTFVDNRPEAHSPEFFINIYYSLQQSKKNFDKFDDIYKFNTIVFAHTDRDEVFLPMMINNQNYQLVYLDPILTIFAKKETNPDIIQKYRVTKENFNFESSDESDYVHLARVCLLFNWQEKSRDFLQKAYAINPNNLSVLNALGYLHTLTPVTKPQGEIMLEKYKTLSSQIWF